MVTPLCSDPSLSANRVAAQNRKTRGIVSITIRPICGEALTFIEDCDFSKAFPGFVQCGVNGPEKAIAAYYT
jgi:hypothetical protein